MSVTWFGRIRHPFVTKLALRRLGNTIGLSQAFDRGHKVNRIGRFLDDRIKGQPLTRDGQMKSCAEIHKVSLGAMLTLLATACSLRGDLDTPVDSLDAAAAALTIISDTIPHCESCVIEMTHAVTLGRERDSVLISRTPIVVRDSKDRSYVSVADWGFHAIIVYGPDGELLRTIGRRGEGPGEHTRIETLSIAPGDSLIVAHNYLRFSVYDSDGRLAREGRLPFPPRQLVHTDDGLLANGSLPTPSSFGLPVHRFNATGEYVASFGTENIFQDRAPPFRVLSPRVIDGTIWVAEQTQYRLEKLDLSGKVLRTIAVQTPWWFVFATHEAAAAFFDTLEAQEPPPEAAPGARPDRLVFQPDFRIAGVVPDSTGLLWVAYNTAVPDWDEVEVVYDRSTSERRLADEMKTVMYRTVLDVIEPEHGVLLSRLIVPGYGWLANDGTFLTVSHSARHHFR